MSEASNTPSMRAVAALWVKGMAFIAAVFLVFGVMLGPFLAAAFLAPDSFWIGLASAWIIATFVLMVAIAAVYNP